MILFRIALLSLTFLVHSQQMRILLFGGWQQCWTKSPDKNTNFITSKGLSYLTFPSFSGVGSCNLQVRIKKNSRLYFEYGLVFSPHVQNFAISSDDKTVYIPGRTRLNYIKIPLNIQYKVLNSRYFKSYFGAGPQGGILLAEKGSIAINSSNFDAGSYFKNATFGYTINNTSTLVLAGIHFTGRIGIDGTLTNIERAESYHFYFPLTTTPTVFLKHKPNCKHYTMYFLCGFAINIDKEKKKE